MSFSFFKLVYRILQTLMDLCFDFTAPTRCFDVLFSTSNMLVNKQSDFLALGFLTFVWVIRKLGLIFVIYSGVDTISAPIIPFGFCWSSHLSACWYIFFYVIQTFVLKIRPVAQWLANTNSIHIIFKTRWL